MNKKRSVIGSHAFLFLDGSAFTLPNPGGTVGRAAKPGATDPAWIDAGVSKWKIGNTGKTEEFFAPVPGSYQLYDEIVVSKGITLKGTLMEMTNLIWQMLLSTATLPATGAGGQFNPNEGSPVVKAWVKLQNYDQDNALINTMDVYVSMKIPGDVEFGDKPVDVDVEAKVLWSPYNTGTLG